jgi:Protein of unknown function (DUF3152)
MGTRRRRQSRRSKKRVIKYVPLVDPDVRYPQDKFEKELSSYLKDPHGWGTKGYTFKQAKTGIEIRLASPATINTRCGKDLRNLSCAELGGKHMYLNAMRWSHGAPESKLELHDYRQYMVSHEMGHILGHEHVSCPGRGHPAPIMMQQTLGIGQCTPSTRV